MENDLPKTIAAQEVLDEARAIRSDRGAIYGHPYINHRRIAGLWSSYLDFPIMPDQVAICMALVKVCDLLKRQVTREEMVTLMAWPISHLLPNCPRPTLTSSMPIRKLQTRSIWCSICKQAYRETNPLHQTPAVWQVISESHERAGRITYYCQPHANEAQMWHDGTIWTFRQQLDYAQGKEKIDGMEFGQL